jgi:TatD DNase family protein
MDLVDTHCHIQSIGLKKGERITRELWAKAPELKPDGVVEAAAEAGVTKLICVGCDLEDSRLAAGFAAEYDGCWASIGIHPHEAQHYAPRSENGKMADFAALARAPKVVAIGETGLDYYYEHSPKADQIKLLEFQIGLASETDLPLIFHVREAFDDFWPVFDNFKGVRGVLHSFTDSRTNLDKALAKGLHIGINGIATFAKDPAQLEVYKAVPADRLLLETDAPFLTPTPYRGSINEPKRLGAIADFLSGLRGENRQTLAETTTGNARRLFGI